MTHRISFFMGLIIFVTAGMAVAQAPVGKIDEVRQPATVTRTDGGKADAKEGMPIFPGDIIETGEDGEIRFSIDRLGRFRLREETEISVDELSGTDDDDTVLRLVAGYLKAVIAKVGPGDRTVVYTPTAVIGVRGTEFDAMAAIDATTLVAVDEGTVDVLSQDKTMTVAQGMMFESGIGDETTAPGHAIPKEKINWRHWRRQREKQFLEKCDDIAPRFKRRYVNWTKRFAGLSEELNTASLRVAEELGTARTAKQNGKKVVFNRAVKRLKTNAAAFGKMTVRYRKVLNRVRIAENMLNRMEKFLVANKDRMKPEKADRALKILGEIREQREQTKQTAKETVSTVKTTVRDLRAFRRELRW